MGRDYVSESRKKRTRIPKASRSEVHGTHLSDDLMRMLPSELLNLEDETLEHLFYARLLEKQKPRAHPREEKTIFDHLLDDDDDLPV